MEKLVGWLGDHDGQVQERWISQRKPRSYWVYLPPYPSIEEARAMLQTLKEDCIKDFLRVIKGPSVNAISLGLFGKRESAEQRVRLLRRRGYKPEMKIRYDDFRERWLDVEFIRDGDFPDQAFLAEYSLLLPIGQPCR
ncbi:MAG: SPOR domain-containing protein [Gammaproteobacteria bacterium]|nr:SPOR domain-containing protein [Gammaproteobacteria bacterium]